MAPVIRILNQKKITNAIMYDLTLVAPVVCELQTNAWKALNTCVTINWKHL